MASQEPSSRTMMSGYESVFGKAKGMVFPRIVLVGHGVLDELATTCRQFGFPHRGAVVTGPKTADIAGRRAATILEEGGFQVAMIIAQLGDRGGGRPGGPRGTLRRSRVPDRGRRR